jgi:hypothetical protein
MKCIDQNFPCQNHQYPEFDNVLVAELRKPTLAHEIVNASQYCTLVPTDEVMQLEDLTHRDYLKALSGKIGLYHLWVDYDNCDDHDTHTMLCVYVGKGFAEVRVDSHIKKRWPKPELLYVSFYECSNRMSKYLEQLFLDTYSFHLNKNENPGQKYLHAVWDHERHLLGTQAHEISNLVGAPLD